MKLFRRAEGGSYSQNFPAICRSVQNKDQTIAISVHYPTRFKRMEGEHFLKFMETATPAHPEKPVFFGKIGDNSVFIKKIPLCALEEDHPNLTANYFQLPQHYHYGVESMGFGG